MVEIDGDLITGENTFLESSTKYVDVIVKPLVERWVRWASTYGNHDSQFNLSREGIFAAESAYALSYTRHGQSNTTGVTNYYLLLYPEKEEDGEEPVAILWFFDSQGGFPFQNSSTLGIPQLVTNDTVLWFQSARDAMVADWGVLPSLAFVHIPPTPFLTIQTPYSQMPESKTRIFRV